MKRLLVLVMLGFSLMCVELAEARFDESHRLLKDSAGTIMLDFSLTSNTAVTSEIINVERNAGFVALLITEDKAGGAGDVDISAEYSIDKTNWYTVNTSDMSGSLEAEGLISLAFGNTTTWIKYTPNPSKYLRFKFDPDADSQVTVRFIFVESK